MPLEAFYAFLERHADYHCLFVDDGSTDGTVEVLKQAEERFPDRISVLIQSQNGGKAEAVRSGMMHAASQVKFDYIGFIDADLSAPLKVMPELQQGLDDHLDFNCAFGSRVKRLGAKVERRFTRHLSGRIFATVATRILHVTAYDSQCGAKLFRAEAVEKLFNEPFLSPWFFDLEIIMRASQENIIEVPISEWKEVGESKIKFWDFMKAPFEILKIRRHYFRR